MIPPIKLTDARVTSFHQRGYVLPGPVMDEALIGEFCAYLATLPPRPEDKGTLFFTQKRGEFGVMADFVARGPQIPLMNQLIGPNLRCWFDQFVVKPPHADAGVFPWHQDNGYNAPCPDNNITLWIALDETTIDNGCIWVVPASHKMGLVPHKKNRPDSWHIEVEAGDSGLAVPLQPGEAVAFTGYTLHRSMGNRTDRGRRAFFLEYCDADAVFADKTPINQRPATDLFAGGLSPVLTGVSRYT